MDSSFGADPLVDAFLVGAHAAADDQRPGVEPDAVAAFHGAFALDAAEDGNLALGIGLFVQGGLGDAQRLAHAQQDRAVVGYPYIAGPNGQQVADLTKPYFGQNDFRGDAFIGFRSAKLMGRRLKWSVQLNMRNLVGDDELIVVTANFDGTPGSVRIPPEKAWLLTSTFQF